MFEQSGGKAAEAAAVVRVAAAAKDVQEASAALERLVSAVYGASQATLQLAHLTSAMQELEAARDALDALLAQSNGDSSNDLRRAKP